MSYNEPAGGQEVWHYHQHVVPRYLADNYYLEQGAPMSIERRVEYAARIRDALGGDLDAL
jgi:histidine triad (HIT) family protein